ncbi:TPA: HYD1 signature containing ADP-ribosyltransferase family protein [Vibrio diabolicus]
MAEDTDKNENPETLYHYTNAEGQKAILESQKLKPSLKEQNPQDARYGDGQYLTDIEPNTKSKPQISRALVGLPYHGARFSHYIEIDVKNLDVQEGRKHVYVVKNDEDLDLSERIVSSGENTK